MPDALECCAIDGTRQQHCVPQTLSMIDAQREDMYEPEMEYIKVKESEMSWSLRSTRSDVQFVDA